MIEPLTFALLAQLYAAWAYNPAEAEATLRVESPEIAHALSVALADENFEDSGLSLLEGDPDKPLMGQLFRLGVGVPKPSLGVFAPTVDVLLKRPRARVLEPAHYFVVGSDTPDVTDALRRYRNVLSFVSLLCESAAYLDREHAHLVFVKDGKFVVPVEYTTADLKSLDVASLARLLDAFGQDLHRDQKLAILAEEVIDLTILEPAARRFPALLTAIGKLADRFFAGYRLFASSFSYDKIRNQLEEARLEYTGKIHKALTDIQSQLLTIPVATVIVATQLKETRAINSAFWSNCAVLLGAAIFGVLLSLMIRNQARTLAVIGAEIHRQKNAMRAQFPDAVGTFGDVFASLDDHMAGQRWVLRTVRTLLWLGLAIAVATFCILTEPALIVLQWLACNVLLLCK
jgi:hypothetical protein